MTGTRPIDILSRPETSTECRCDARLVSSKSTATWRPSHDCALVDGQKLFHAIGLHGFLDDDLFHDAMHPSLRGHIALATAILEVLHSRRWFGWPTDLPAPAIEPARLRCPFRPEIARLDCRLPAGVDVLLRDGAASV